MIKAYDERFERFTPEEDEKYLRRAIAVSKMSVEHGNTPFGAILVDIDGNILMEQENIELTERDCTGHAETTLLRRASHEYEKSFLWDCTLYTSCEPCCMCCGAAYWANVGRIVFAAAEQDLLKVTGNNEINPTFKSDSRSLLDKGQKAMVIQGPMESLRDEALAVHKDFFK